jgi:hypothetical protein
MSKYLFYVGPEHHKYQLKFTKELLGGDYFISGSNSSDMNTYSKIKHLDSEDVVWFFADLYENVIPFLKGKSVFIPHGLGFKPYCSDNMTRKIMLRDHIDQIWSAGFIDETKYLDVKISKDKIERIGYTVLFDIPNVQIIPDSVFIAVGWFEELVSWEHMLTFLQSIPDSVKVFLGMHPSMPETIKNNFLSLLNERDNFTYVTSGDETYHAFAVSSCAIGGWSSVLTPFFYMKKPYIFMKNRNRFPLFQWQRLRLRVQDNLFYKILSESTKLLAPTSFNRDIVFNAKTSVSGSKVFYETNWDKNETAYLMKKALMKL